MRNQVPAHVWQAFRQPLAREEGAGRLTCVYSRIYFHVNVEETHGRAREKKKNRIIVVRRRLETDTEKKGIHADHLSFEQAASEVMAAVSVKGSGQPSTSLDGPLFIQLMLWK